MELRGITANFLGDSITEGCGTSSQEATYHGVLKKLYGMKEARNYGVGGTRVARQGEITSLVRDRDFLLRARDMSDDADLVVVFGGTNDFGHGQASLGEMDDRTIYTFYGALHTLVCDLKDKYPNKPIVFITPLHRHNEDGRGAWKPEGVVQHPLVDYVTAVKEVCAYYKVPCLDLFVEEELRASGGDWYPKYMPDGLHPNDAGHEIIARKLGEFLENL